MKNHKTKISKMVVVLLSGLCLLLSAVVVEAEIICGGPNDVPLCAGQSINVGKVTVWNDADDLFVTYNVDTQTGFSWKPIWPLQHRCQGFLRLKKETLKSAAFHTPIVLTRAI